MRVLEPRLVDLLGPLDDLGVHHRLVVEVDAVVRRLDVMASLGIGLVDDEEEVGPHNAVALGEAVERGSRGSRESLSTWSLVLFPNG